MDTPVVVGVDGSQPSLLAVRWAAAEAAHRRTTLHIVHAWSWPLPTVSLGPETGEPALGELSTQPENVLVVARRIASQAAPGVPVDTTVVTGDAASRLIEESRGAQLTVVGDRGLGGFAGLLLGSVGHSLAAHAHSPVLVVRGADRPEAPVAIGVESPERSEPTVRRGFEEAAARGTSVLAVHCFTMPAYEAPSRLLSHDEQVRLVDEAQGALVEGALEMARKEFPDVPVEVMLGERTPAHELVLVSRSAGLVVVGARGGGGFAGLLLGSAPRALVHHADCPVLVERHNGV